jgi:hypothetical protein
LPGALAPGRALVHDRSGPRLRGRARATPPGGSIHVSVKREGDDAVLRVRDSGIGISPDLPPRMLDLLVQGGPGSERSARTAEPDEGLAVPRSTHPRQDGCG